MKYTPILPENNDNISHESPVKELFILSAGIIGIVIGIYVALGFAVNWIVPHISLETEKKMAALFSGVTGKGEDTSPRAKHIQALCDRFQKSCAKIPYEVNIHIIENEIANAIALPGGNILLCSGLLEKMGSENELAYVLLHEFGHFSNRDHLKGFGRSLVFVAISAALFGPDSTVGNLIAGSIGISETGFSRVQETDADEFGIEGLQCAYGHVNGATDFFEKMSKAEDPHIFGNYFSTHPETLKRIEHIKAYARENGFDLKEKKPLPDQFKKISESD